MIIIAAALLLFLSMNDHYHHRHHHHVKHQSDQNIHRHRQNTQLPFIYADAFCFCSIRHHQSIINPYHRRHLLQKIHLQNQRRRWQQPQQRMYYSVVTLQNDNAVPHHDKSCATIRKKYISHLHLLRKQTLQERYPITNYIRRNFIRTKSSSHSVMLSKNFNSNDDNVDNNVTLLNDDDSQYKTNISNNYNNNNEDHNNESILNRFISPMIHDPNLPYSDVMTAMIVAPTIQLLINVIILGNPLPTWCSTDSFSLLLPTILHGSQLALCWLLGALAAKLYERKSISPQLIVYDKNTKTKRAIQVTNDMNTEYILQLDDIRSQNNMRIMGWDYQQILLSICKAGLFAIGLLLLSAQIDLFIEYNGRMVQYGDSDEINFSFVVAIIEMTNDVFYEAIILSIWRFLLAYQTERQWNTIK